MNAPTKIQAETVYAKIAAVQGALAKIGIGKNRQNNSPGGNYAFRGIDDVYNALAPLLAEHRLCVIPRILSRELAERKSAKGNPLFYITVDAEFDFVSADDGSIHTARTFGEAMDSGDKGTNKAMSAAYKYAAFMTFAIPTEGDNDADATTHEVLPEIKLIDDAQWSELVTLMETTHTNAEAFCQAYKIGSVKELPAAAFGRAKTQLNTKLSKMQEKEPA